GLNIIAPPEGGYKDKSNNTNSQSGAKNDKNESAKNDKNESAKNDKQESSQNNSNTQVINPPNSGQKTEI
ncbi:vacuolating cyotoxin family protein, partial [Helicobacter pylori]